MARRAAMRHERQSSSAALDAGRILRPPVDLSRGAATSASFSFADCVASWTCRLAPLPWSPSITRRGGHHRSASTTQASRRRNKVPALSWEAFRRRRSRSGPTWRAHLTHRGLGQPPPMVGHSERPQTAKIETGRRSTNSAGLPTAELNQDTLLSRLIREEHWTSLHSQACVRVVAPRSPPGPCC